MRVHSLIFGVSILVLTGCATEPPRKEAAPVRDSSSAPPPVAVEDEESGVVIRAYEPPETVAIAPSHGSAVQSLLTQADKQQAAGNQAAAVGSIERALRIEPRNAFLWNKLAELRLQQGMYGLAEELATKSTSLAAGDVPLKKNNWQIIAQARHAQGDTSGARVAERKARMLY